MLVVDDGSRDDGPERAAATPGVRLLCQTNAGPSAARNRGLLATRAPLVAFLDADDTWAPDFLESLAGLLAADPGAGFACCCQLDGGGAPLVPPDRVPVEGPPARIRYFEAMCEGYFINPSAALVRRSAIARTGGFDERARWGEDPDFFGRLALRFPVCYSPRPLAVQWDDAPNRQRAVAHPPVYPPFLRSLERAPEVPPAARELGHKLRLEHAADWIARDRPDRAREVLARCLGTRRFRPLLATLLFKAALPVPALRLARRLRRALRAG